MVPRIDPPVGIRGRPTCDLRTSGLFGVSQSCLAVVVENERAHFVWTARELTGVQGARRDKKTIGVLRIWLQRLHSKVPQTGPLKGGQLLEQTSTVRKQLVPEGPVEAEAIVPHS